MNMAIKIKHLFVLLIFYIWTNGVSPERTKDKMYQRIEGKSACFRRLNGTHQFGCGSARSGNVGIIQIIENQSDVDWIVNEGQAVPYAAVMKPKMFTSNVLLALKKSGKINGIALVNDTRSSIELFSHEDTCPNRYSGLSSFHSQTCNDNSPWNDVGTKLFLEDFDFPIFYIYDDESIESIYKCYESFNSFDRENQVHRSLCALELNSYMYAAVDSKTCIRRNSVAANFNRMKMCDPLGDRNIWMTLFPRSKKILEKNQVIMLSTRLDGASLFDGIVHGAVSPIVGVVTLIATAHHLSELLPYNNVSNPAYKNVLFTFFNGEAYDYIGSSRMLWDMQQNNFPYPLDDKVDDQPPLLSVNNISLFVELGQLSQHFKEGLVFHYASSVNKQEGHDYVKTFMKNMQEVGDQFGMKFVDSNGDRLPPASLQVFLANESSLPGVIIADHNQSFTNKFYHSIYDDDTWINYKYQNGSEPVPDSIQMFVANLSTTLAHTLYYLVTGEKYQNESAVRVQMVDELLNCYLITSNCTLFQAATYKQKLEDKPASMYIGVSHWNNVITTLTGQLLALLTGTSVNKSMDDCHNDPENKVFQYIWMSGMNSSKNGVCIQTTMDYSIATSPAFIIDGYDWASGMFSTWTESVWQTFTARIFLKPSQSHENMVISVGTIVLILSFVVVYFINSRSHILFGNAVGC